MHCILHPQELYLELFSSFFFFCFSVFSSSGQFVFYLDFDFLRESVTLFYGFYIMSFILQLCNLTRLL